MNRTRTLLAGVILLIMLTGCITEQKTEDITKNPINKGDLTAEHQANKYFATWYKLSTDIEVPKPNTPFKYTVKFTSLLFDLENVTLNVSITKLEVVKGQLSWTGTVKKGETKQMEIYLQAPEWDLWETDPAIPEIGIFEQKRYGLTGVSFSVDYPYTELINYVEKNEKELYPYEYMRNELLEDIQRNKMLSSQKEEKYTFGTGSALSVYSKTKTFEEPK